MRNLFFLVLVIPFLYQCESSSNEIKQWRGNNRDGIYYETNLLKEWPKDGPELLWSNEELSMGNSSLSIGHNSIYLTGTDGSTDEIIALDLDGNIKWRTEYGRTWTQSFPEARCTPTIDGDRLYVTSGLGDIACINALTGDIIWKVEAAEKYEAHLELWGIAESPLVIDDKVILTPVGEKSTMVAFDKLTGEEKWVCESIHDSTAYVSPILIQYPDKDLIVNITASNIVGVNAANGNLEWNYSYYNLNTPTWHANAPIINCVTPVYNDNQLYVTSGYNHVGAMFKLKDNGSGIEHMWTDTILDTHHGGVVTVDGYIYGSNWLNNRDGNWCCINWETGEKMYETKWETKGSIIYADGMLYCYDEMKGNLALVEADPNEFKIVSSFKIPLGTGPHWMHPVINDGILYVRHGKALMAYNIKQT